MQENGVRAVAAPSPHTQQSSSKRTATTNASVASIPRPARKQLTPQASQVPGRVTTISYPRGGNRATFTPLAATKTAAAMGDTADNSTRSRIESDAQREEEKTGSPGLDEVTGQERSDLGRLATRNESEDKRLGLCRDRPSPSQQQPSQQQPSRFTNPTQPPCPVSEEALLNDHATSSTVVEMSDPNNMLGTAVGDADGIGAGGGGGREDDASTRAESRKSAECRESPNGLVGGGCPTAVAPTRPPATAGNNEQGFVKSLTNSGEVEGVECGGAKGGLEVDVDSSPVPPRLDQAGAESETPGFRSRLVNGVPVFKYGGGGRGKPKPKVLWVTPDLSEIFYTQAGR